MSQTDLSEIAGLADQGFEAHGKGRLNEASSLYLQTLALDPPVRPTAGQVELALKFAPRLQTVPGEFFPLKDIVAILHPERPAIGYHLFWEDDIDFPDDNQPCDHEVDWVEYDAMTQQVTKISAYLHGRIEPGNEAPAEANAHGGRPWIGVEWGKHGSLAWGAPDQADGAGQVLQRNWFKLHTNGRRAQAHPLSRNWPVKFEGDFQAYTNFSVPVDPRPLLRERQMIWVTRWPNAVINQYCLRYNFCPKTPWPWPGN